MSLNKIMNAFDTSEAKIYSLECQIHFLCAPKILLLFIIEVMNAKSDKDLGRCSVVKHDIHIYVLDWNGYVKFRCKTNVNPDLCCNIVSPGHNELSVMV